MKFQLQNRCYLKEIKNIPSRFDKKVVIGETFDVCKFKIKSSFLPHSDIDGGVFQSNMRKKGAMLLVFKKLNFAKTN